MSFVNDNNIVSDMFYFYDRPYGELLNPNVINLDNDKKIESIEIGAGEDTQIITSDKFTWTNLVLSIPGIGLAHCGDIIITKKPREQVKQYVLQMGWHENISNQKIFSWYLVPVETNLEEVKLSHKYKTLYYDDLCNIIGITNLVPNKVPNEIIE